jgi:hypothetical protein
MQTTSRYVRHEVFRGIAGEIATYSIVMMVDEVSKFADVSVSGEPGCSVVSHPSHVISVCFLGLRMELHLSQISF